MYWLIPAVISSILIGAHFLRYGEFGLVALFISIPLVLLINRQWTKRILQLALLAGAGIWCVTLAEIIMRRMALGQPYLRVVMILGSITVFCVLSAVLFELYQKPLPKSAGDTAALITFLLCLAVFSIVQLKVKLPVILLERFLKGGGWLEAFWLSVYAGWLITKVIKPRDTLRLRPRLWSLFSLVFFLQLALGLSGFERFLMTGQLHFPIPALIIGGPIYRGSGFFMLILFSVTVLLVGPAWCSWLCYIGSWDDQAARLNRKRHELPRWRRYLRIVTLVLVVTGAYLMRSLGVSGLIVGYLTISFGLVGVIFMLTWSKDSGQMTHCTAFCPIGLLATTFGKISPFRIKINSGCDQCGACTKTCRYDSLTAEDLRELKPGASCTLCGDCLASCKNQNINYHFLELSPEQARTMFLILVISMHAVFLGVARI